MLTGSPMAEVLAHYRPGIEASEVLDRLGLEPGGYVVASLHREENVDEAGRLGLVVAALGDLADELDCPVLVSTHPRTRKRLDASGIGERRGIVFHEPFGFLDYVHLQTRARCVLSDSGTISEESAILGFPAVTLRDAIERPEAIESGSIISCGLESEAVVAAVRQVLAQRAAGEVPDPPAEYRVSDFSQRVVNIIRSTMHTHHAWAGIRLRSPVWEGRNWGHRGRAAAVTVIDVAGGSDGRCREVATRSRGVGRSAAFLYGRSDRR